MEINLLFCAGSNKKKQTYGNMSAFLSLFCLISIVPINA